MAREDEDRFETIAWVYSQSELAVLLSLLAHEDIYVLPIGRGHASVAWGNTLALGGIEVRVHAAEAEDARLLLAGIDRTPFRRGVFSDNRLVDGLIMVVLTVAGLFVPPARIPAVFVAPAVVRRAD
ncbi:MAG TPA: hypothetical protein VMS43_13615 [Allosphingosinicella sp.]|nr:hypothetical protein [Allosphingosinicella sp.]